MKVSYYSKYSARGPSSRFRAFQFQNLFAEAGIDYKISELFDDRYFEILRGRNASNLRKIPYTVGRFIHRRQVLRQDQSDLRIVEQQLFPYIPFVIEKRYLPKRYLLEFDDAIYLTHHRKFPKMIREAAAIIAGNDFLAAYSQQFNDNVHVVPTVLNTNLFKPSLKSPRTKLKIGWSGIEYNFPFLNLLAPVLSKMVALFPVEVTVLSATPPQRLDFPFVHQRWDPKREVEQMNEFDIGLMPLKMDEWCKGKCGLKLLQYMALEIPSIATAVGVNKKIVCHGVNGFLAEELSDWERCLIELINDAALRQSVGREARTTVVTGYSTTVWFPKLVELYRSYI